MVALSVETGEWSILEITPVQQLYELDESALKLGIRQKYIL